MRHQGLLPIALAASSLLPAAALASSSLRFHGNGDGRHRPRQGRRSTIPPIPDPGPPADVGATDFTIEFWMKAAAADNTAGPVSCGSNVDWINGNIVVDRDRFGLDRKFGVSIAGGTVVFGVSGDGTGDRTICGVRPVLDSAWHHVAVERRRSDGRLWLYVDGILDAESDGPDGDVSYPDDAVARGPRRSVPRFRRREARRRPGALPLVRRLSRRDPALDRALATRASSRGRAARSPPTRTRRPSTGSTKFTGDLDRRRLGRRGRALGRAAALRRLAGRAGVVAGGGAARGQPRDHVLPADRTPCPRRSRSRMRATGRAGSSSWSRAGRSRSTRTAPCSRRSF